MEIKHYKSLNWIGLDWDKMTEFCFESPFAISLFDHHQLHKYGLLLVIQLISFTVFIQMPTHLHKTRFFSCFVYICTSYLSSFFVCVCTSLILPSSHSTLLYDFLLLCMYFQEVFFNINAKKYIYMNMTWKALASISLKCSQHWDETSYCVALYIP